jgi:hypothetical protein
MEIGLAADLDRIAISFKQNQRVIRTQNIVRTMEHAII